MMMLAPEGVSGLRCSPGGAAVGLAAGSEGLDRCRELLGSGDGLCSCPAARFPVSVRRLRKCRILFSSGVRPPSDSPRNRSQLSRSRIMNSNRASDRLCCACRSQRLEHHQRIKRWASIMHAMLRDGTLFQA